MRKVDKSIELANISLGKSVIEVNPNIEIELLNKSSEVLTFGVKNTNDIPKIIIEKLNKNNKYQWLTIDKMSHIGRSIDVDLTNPLTYRSMTGSTSGGPINILTGINDFCIGTDGGGSILAPALSCNLYSIMGAGIGLNINKESISTDKYKFSPSIGVISKDLSVIKEVINDITDIDLNSHKNNKIKVVIPSKNNITLPDGNDMYDATFNIMASIEENVEFISYDFKNLNNRNISIEEINNIFNNNLGDLILTFEGPVDVYGYDETIQRSFSGIAEKSITDNGGKYLAKAANICNCTAITIPSDSLASGYVICSPSGEENAKNAYRLAKAIDKIIQLPEVFKRYFINNEKFVKSMSFYK